MDNLLSDHNNNITLDRDMRIIMAVLESGHSIELPAKGYSMFPTLRDGDRVVVRPLSEGEFPKPGSVVIYVNNGLLVMHRLIEIIADDSGKILCITRGDSKREPDKPWLQQEIIGVAGSYKRGKKEHSIKTSVPDFRRYLFNHRLLWIFNKIMQLTKVPDKKQTVFNK